MQVNDPNQQYNNQQNGYYQQPNFYNGNTGNQQQQYGYNAGGQQLGGYQQNAYYGNMVPQNGPGALGLVALIISLLSLICCGLTSIIGLILGIIAKIKCKWDKRATAAIIISIIEIIILILIIIFGGSKYLTYTINGVEHTVYDERETEEENRETREEDDKEEIHHDKQDNKEEDTINVSKSLNAIYINDTAIVFGAYGDTILTLQDKLDIELEIQENNDLSYLYAVAYKEFDNGDKLRYYCYFNQSNADAVDYNNYKLYDIEIEVYNYGQTTKGLDYHDVNISIYDYKLDTPLTQKTSLDEMKELIKEYENNEDWYTFVYDDGNNYHSYTLGYTDLVNNVNSKVHMNYTKDNELTSVEYEYYE